MEEQCLLTLGSWGVDSEAWFPNPSDYTWLNRLWLGLGVRENQLICNLLMHIWITQPQWVNHVPLCVAAPIGLYSWWLDPPLIHWSGTHHEIFRDNQPVVTPHWHSLIHSADTIVWVLPSLNSPINSNTWISTYSTYLKMGTTTDP